MAVRLSLGAGRFRIVRQLLTESVMLASLGGALGIVFAIWGVQALTLLLSKGQEEFTLHAELNWSVLGATALLSVISGLFFCLVPAIHSTWPDVLPALKNGRGRGPRRRTQQVLVVAQIAMSFLILFVAGLFVRTLDQLHAVQLGYARENILLFSLLGYQAAPALRSHPRRKQHLAFARIGLALWWQVMRIALPPLFIAAVSAAPPAVESNAWTAPLAYSAPPLKSNALSLQYAKPLVAAGYTVFSVNHRATPRFRYPAAIEDAQRAVRFIRHHAGRYGIRPDRIGAVGGSSGGHLGSMLGTLDGPGRANDPDPVERKSSRVQCVVARAAPTDRLKLPSTPFVAMSVPAGDEAMQKEFEEYRTLVVSSPVSHISRDDPPFFPIHGDKDRLVPFDQSIEFEKAFRGVGIPANQLRIPGAAWRYFPGSGQCAGLFEGNG